MYAIENYPILEQNYCQYFKTPYTPAFQGGASSHSAQALRPVQSTYLQNPIIQPCPPDTVNFSAENKIKTAKPEKKGMSTTAKLLLSAGITAIAGLGIWLATKGKVKPQSLTEAQTKKLEELISSGKIDRKYAEIFKNMNGLDMPDWFYGTYRDLAKSMGYRFKYDLPELKVCTKYADGGTHSLTEITINMQDGVTTYSQILGAMRHELEHFRQDDLIYRSFGEEEFINARILPMINRIKNNEASCIKETGKKCSELTNADIEKYKEDARKMLKKDCYSLRSLLERKGKIEAGSEQYKEAELYLKGLKNYESPFLYDENLTKETIQEMHKTNPERVKFLQEVYKRYESNPLEVGANRESKKFIDMYNLFSKEVLGKN